MFKHVQKYTDYNGTERSDTLYFNFSKAELMEMELSTQAGIQEMIRMMIATSDNAKIVQLFKDLILKSYGIKSEDGKRFIKSQELRDQFEQSEAYSEFFMAMIANEDDIQTKFVNGVVAGTNVPNASAEEAIAKLKELGYDTTLMEKKAEEAKVVPINDEVAAVEDSKPNA
jgi:hypothetical protein